MDSESNIRPLSIFTGYMVLAAALTVICLGTAKSSRVALTNSTRAKVALFSLLAALSLGTTWYYMFEFFRWSYIDWATSQSPALGPEVYTWAGIRLGDWLQQTTLFRQAWVSVLLSPEKAWWSVQIFGFCAILSVMVPVQGKRRNIQYTWAFILLGQIVAISFAANLFFLATLLHRPTVTQTKKPSKQASDVRQPQPSSWWNSTAFWNGVVLIATLQSSLQVTVLIQSPNFMLYLLAPHLLAFVPIILSRVIHDKTPELTLREPAWYTKLFILITLITQQVRAVNSAGTTWNVVWDALHQHPAVSSVGWDVICCWVSFSLWQVLGEE